MSKSLKNQKYQQQKIEKIQKFKKYRKSKNVKNFQKIICHSKNRKFLKKKKFQQKNIPFASQY